MKKQISIFLAAVMAAGVLSACGAGTDQAATDAASTEGSAAADSAAAGASGNGSVIDISGLKTMTLSEVEPADLVTLGDYKGVTVEVASPSVTEDQVTEYIDNLKATNAPTVDVTDRAVENGDTVDIDYVGKFADTGVAFDGGTANGASLTIGSHSYIDGFEDGLIGVNIGETVDLDLTFPENYGSAELAGKDVVFTVTVNGIKAPTDDLTSEWFSSLGYENVTDMEGLRAAVKDSLMKDAESNYQSDVENAAIDAVLENCTFSDVPEELTNRYLTQVYQQFNYYALQYSYYTGTQSTLEDYLKMVMQSGGESGTPEEFIRNRADKTTKQYVMFAAIAKNENIEVTDEDVDQFLKENYESAASTSYSTYEEYKAEQDLDVFREGIMADKVVDFLADNANVVEPAN